MNEIKKVSLIFQGKVWSTWPECGGMFIGESLDKIQNTIGELIMEDKYKLLPTEESASGNFKVKVDIEVEIIQPLKK